MATWVWALLWSKAHETRGFVPEVAVRGAWVGRRQAVKDFAILVSVGLARATTDGWRLRRWQAGRPLVRGPLRAEVILRCGLVCGICGGPVPETDVQIDHVIPLARGGPHEAANLQVSHSLCNQRKGAR
jgi:hypothetical protein